MYWFVGFLVSMLLLVVLSEFALQDVKLLLTAIAGVGCVAYLALLFIAMVGFPGLVWKLELFGVGVFVVVLGIAFYKEEKNLQRKQKFPEKAQVDFFGRLPKRKFWGFTQQMVTYIVMGNSVYLVNGFHEEAVVGKEYVARVEGGNVFLKVDDSNVFKYPVLCISEG